MTCILQTQIRRQHENGKAIKIKLELDHKKTTLVAENHPKLVTWMDMSIMFFQETKMICSSDHLPFLQYSYKT